jgi:hypothetical protein
MTDLFIANYTMACVEAEEAGRMRKIRPAYRKAKLVIDSCKTPEQLMTAHRYVEAFITLHPYADKFAVELYRRVYSHEHGETVMDWINDGKA